MISEQYPTEEQIRAVREVLHDRNLFINCHGPAVLDQLLEERNEMLQAIKEHRSQRADDRCIEDDDRLYAVLDDGIACDRRVGDKVAMLQNCAAFIANRCQGGGWQTYASLLEERDRLRNELSQSRQEEARLLAELANFYSSRVQ